MDSYQQAAFEKMAKENKKKKGIPGSTIKIIACVTMLIDHIAATILARILIQNGYYAVWAMTEEQQSAWYAKNGALYIVMMVMRLIGRLGFPLFCFLLIEGFEKTKNVGKYALRLGLFALVSEVPFDLALSGTFLEFENQNVFFTLFIGLLTIWGIDRFKKWEKPLGVGVIGFVFGIGGVCFLCIWYLTGEGIFALVVGTIVLIYLLKGIIDRYHTAGIAGALDFGTSLFFLTVGMMLANFLSTDYAGMGILTIVIMYSFRENRMAQMGAGCVVLTIMNTTEITSFLAMLPVVKYNGERGLRLKYFFYAFYPAHLLLLWLICLAMGMGWISAV